MPWILVPDGSHRFECPGLATGCIYGPTAIPTRLVRVLVIPKGPVGCTCPVQPAFEPAYALSSEHTLSRITFEGVCLKAEWEQRLSRGIIGIWDEASQCYSND